MRRGPLALALLVVLAGCAAPLSPPAMPGPFADDGARPDPPTDRRGWENGYWHDDPLAVTPADGLNDTELEAVVARAMARVEHIRDVEFRRSVPVTVISRAEYRRRYGGGNVSPALRVFDNAKMEALLLVGEDEDSIAVQRQNRNVSVGGFYDTRRDAIVVVAEGRTAVIDETTLGHELVHAWQDRRFNLSGFHGRTRDGVNARQGIVEGDANYVQHHYRRGCDRGWECIVPEDEGGGGGSLGNFGVYVLKFQPYSDGPTFVEHRRGGGGWAAVNAVYEDPPASAEQVIHPGKYGRDEPTSVRLDDRTGGSWERVRPPGRPDYGVVGQAGIMAMLVYPTYHSDGDVQIVPADEWINRKGTGVDRFDPLDYGHRYAAGWDGDRLHVYRNDENETGYVWRIVWDSPAEAREFLEGYRKVLHYWGATEVADGIYRIEGGPFADAISVTIDGDTVTIVNAPAVEELSDVRAGAGPDDG